MATDYGDERDRTGFPKDFDSPPGEPPRRSDEDIRRDLESILFYDDLVRSYDRTYAVGFAHRP